MAQCYVMAVKDGSMTDEVIQHLRINDNAYGAPCRG